jgi:uncharacterized Zn finger protein (UPF0148 family)
LEATAAGYGKSLHATLRFKNPAFSRFGVSEHPDKAAIAPNQRCIVCSNPLVEGGAFCPSCGAKTVPSSTLSAIDAYIEKKIDLELSTRLKDANSIVRELGDRAEGVVWNRLRLATWAFGLFLFFIAFLGLNTYSGVSRNIDRVAAAAEQRVQDKVDTIKASLERLSHDVDAQATLVAQKGGEISQKLQSLDATADTFSKRLDTMVKSLGKR